MVSRVLLWQLLKQVKMGGYMYDDIMQQFTAVLDRWGPADSMEVNDGKPKEYRVNYNEEQCKGFCEQYKTLTSEASAFMVQEGK